MNYAEQLAKINARIEVLEARQDKDFATQIELNSLIGNRAQIIRDAATKPETIEWEDSPKAKDEEVDMDSELVTAFLGGKVNSEGLIKSLVNGMLEGKVPKSYSLEIDKNFILRAKWTFLVPEDENYSWIGLVADKSLIRWSLTNDQGGWSAPIKTYSDLEDFYGRLRVNCT